MSAYKVVREDEDQFVVHDGQKEFALPKARLRHSTVERIRKYASGGRVQRDYNAEVQRAIDAGGIPPEGFAPSSLPDVPVGRYPNPDARANPSGPQGDMGPETGGEIPPEPGRSRVLQTPDSQKLDLLSWLPGKKDIFKENTPSVWGDSSASSAATLEATQGPGMLERPSDEPVAPTPAPQQAAPKAPADPGSGDVRQLQQSAAQAEEAVRRKADLEGFYLKQQAQTQEAHAQHIQQMQAASQKMLADRAAHTDQLFNDIASDKIDPNHFYETRSVGQKIGGAIGLILGGIGSGLTGQPNAALGIIQKQIDRDIEAQRLNMGKKETLLSRYMQQTGDLMAAQHMAQADYLTAAAAQLAAEHSRAGSAMAAPEAQAIIAQLRAGAVQATQSAVQRSLQIQESKLNLSLSQQHAQALGQLMKGMSGGGGFDRRILEMPGFEKYRERAVDLPDGSVALANSKEEADKSTESFQSVGRFKSKLQRYSELLKSGNPATVDRGAAQSMRADILAEMGHLHDLNRLTDVDLQLFEKQVPDISDFIKPMAAQKLKGLGKSLDDKIWSRNKSLLHLADSSRPKASE